MAWTITLDEFETYEAAREEFSLDLPSDYNLAVDSLRKHDDPDRTALYQAYPDGRRETYSYADLDRESDKLASALADYGIEAGDHVGVCLPQTPEVLLTYLACWKLAAVVVHIGERRGKEPFKNMVERSESKIIITNNTGLKRATTVTGLRRPVEDVILVGEGDRHDAMDSVRTYETFVDNYSPGFEIADTTPKTPACILYTSGSTGPPKGVVLRSETFPTGCVAACMSYEHSIDETAVGWTPASWSRISALVLQFFVMLHYGGSTVGYASDFDPEKSFELMAEFDVTHPFIIPIRLRQLMDATYQKIDDLSISVITSGTSRLTPDIIDWVETSLGAVINEGYGLTEAFMLLADCQTWYEQRISPVGKPIVGQEVAIIDTQTGEERPRGKVGAIALRTENAPALFSEYLNMPEKTTERWLDDWFLTGDLGRQDEDGYMWVFGRDDNAIISSGYNITPEEIEWAVAQHKAVAEVGVIIVEDEALGEVIKAFVELRSGVEPAEWLKSKLKQWVIEQLTDYKSPHNITFVPSVPISDTGKVDREALRQLD